MVQVAGVAFAVLAAVSAAAMTLLLRVGTRKGRMNDAMVTVLVVNVVVVGPVALVTGYPDYQLTPRAVWAFVGAGLVGTLLGRVFYFAAIDRVGASRASTLRASVPLYSTVMAVFLLGETLTTMHFAGILLIVVGIALISWEGASRPTLAGERITLRELSLPLVAAFFFGVEPILAKVGFAAGTPVLMAVTVKTVAALVGFLGYLVWRDALPTAADLSVDRLGWYAAAGIANTVFLLSLYAGLKVAQVVLVIPIARASPLLTVGLSAVFLQRIERVTPRLAGASAIVVVGAIVVSVYG